MPTHYQLIQIDKNGDILYYCEKLKMWIPSQYRFTSDSKVVDIFDEGYNSEP